MDLTLQVLSSVMLILLKLEIAIETIPARFVEFAVADAAVDALITYAGALFAIAKL